MTHYIMTYAADRDPRVPHYLEGSLSPVRVGRSDAIGAAALQPYWSAGSRRYEFVDDLYFISSETTVDLDYYPVADGYLASERMTEVLQPYAKGAVRCRPVRLVNEAGEPNSSKIMSFCQVVDVRDACDFAAMDIGGTVQTVLDSPNLVERRGPDTVVKVSAWISLKDDLPPIFMTREIQNQTVIVDDRVRDALEAADLLGLAFVPVEEIAVVDFTSNGEHGFSKASPHWIERSVLERWERHVDRSRLFDPDSTAARAMLEQLLNGGSHC